MSSISNRRYGNDRRNSDSKRRRLRHLLLERLEDRRLLTLTPVPVTNTAADSFVQEVDASGDRLLLSSSSDLVSGSNSDGNAELFLFQNSTGFFTQITDTTGDVNGAGSISRDGSKIVFSSAATNLPGTSNADGNAEIFLYDIGNGTFTQLTDTSTGENTRPETDDDASHTVFQTTSSDLPGVFNTDGNSEIVIVNAGFTQVTNTTTGANTDPSIGTAVAQVAFNSTSTDLPGVSNTDGNQEVILADISAGTFLQITDTTGVTNYRPDVDGTVGQVVFTSEADLTSENAAGLRQAFLFDVGMSATVQISDFDGADVGAGHPTLSDDGTRVAVYGFRDMGTGIQSTQVNLFHLGGGIEFTDSFSLDVALPLLGLINRDGAFGDAMQAPLNANGSVVTYTFPVDPLTASYDVIRAGATMRVTARIFERPDNYPFFDDDGSVSTPPIRVQATKEIDIIGVGQDFVIKILVEDLQTAEAQGVFSAYVDVNFDGALASLVPQLPFVVHPQTGLATPYLHNNLDPPLIYGMNAQPFTGNGVLDTDGDGVLDQIDLLGSFSSDQIAPGPGEFVLVEWAMKATANGALVFKPEPTTEDPADDPNDAGQSPAFDAFVWSQDPPVCPSQSTIEECQGAIEYVSDAIEIVDLDYGDAPAPVQQLTQGATDPAIDATGSQIVFASSQDLLGSNPENNSELFLLNTSTKLLTQLTSTTSDTSQSPTINADATRIAFASNSNPLGTNADGSFEIFLLDTTTDTLTQVTDAVSEASTIPNISAAGTRIAFESSANLLGTNPDRSSEIFLFDTTTSTLDQVTVSTGQSASPAISSDGMRITFTSNANLSGTNADGSYEIYLFDTATDSFTQITDGDVSASARPSLNSDGTRITLDFAGDPLGTNSDGNGEVFVFDTTTSSFVQITDTTSSYSNHSPAISADGTRIAFTSDADFLGTNADGSDELYLYDGVAASFAQITDAEVSSTSTALSADGTRIVFASDADPFGTNPDGGDEVFLATVPKPLTTEFSVPLVHYPTTMIDNGARHAIVPGGSFLGLASPDGDADGQPEANALGDDNDGNDDEDLADADILRIEVTPGQQDAFLSLWIDFNRNGSWEDEGEQVVDDALVEGGGSPGEIELPIQIPPDFTPGVTFARARISSQENLRSVGPAPDGEVEDFSVDLSCGLTVTRVEDDGLIGSLRSAIACANVTPGLDTVVFDIPGAGVHTIEVGSTGLGPLPDITDPIIIDGYSQPGAAENTDPDAFNGTLLIELDGTNAGPAFNGLEILAGGSTVRGLVINRFQSERIGDVNYGGNAIFVGTGGDNRIEGNILGLNPDGNVNLGNESSGVLIGGAFESSSNNTIGGTVPGARNLIAGNLVGISIEAVDSTGNVVVGNLIGTNAAGTAAIDMNSAGIGLADASNNIIGGNVTGARNVISGNGIGIYIVDDDETSTGNVVLGNYIGTDVTGLLDVGNDVGVAILAGGNTLGETVEGRNIISGNNAIGVVISDFHGEPGTGNVVQSNYIGTDATGSSPLGNGGGNYQEIADRFNQLLLDLTGESPDLTEAVFQLLAGGVGVTGASGHRIGGLADWTENVISGNLGNGVTLAGAHHNVLQGNLIGTDDDGLIAIGNLGNGVALLGSSNNTVGGSTTAAGNVVVNSAANGVLLAGSQTSGNVIQMNWIGTNSTGTAPWGNGAAGVAIDEAANNQIIENTITNNSATDPFTGVAVFSGTQNAIRRNSIFQNEGLGIDLLDDGVTLNDTGDLDSGPNDLLNFPILESATVYGNTLNLSGFARPGAEIEFFLAAPDPTGFGEGKTYLVTLVEGSAEDQDATTGTYGPAPINGLSQGTDTTNRFLFKIPVPGGVELGQVLTATATDADDNTSEFSGNLAIEEGSCSLLVNTTADVVDPLDAFNSLREAVICANVTPGHDTITIAQPGTYTLTIRGADEDAAATGDLDITGNLTMVSASGDPHDVIIDAGGLDTDGEGPGFGDRVFHVHGVRLDLQGITISGGNVGDTSRINDGGGLLSEQGQVTLTDSIVDGNLAQGSGGGLATIGGFTTMTLERTLVSNNRAAQAGGGILSINDTLNIVDSAVRDNRSQLDGGGIYLAGDVPGTLNMSGSTVADNQSTGGDGGGISSDFETLIVSDSLIARNTAALAGGGIHSQSGSLNLLRVTIAENGADTEGGGVHVEGGDGLITASTISGNTNDASGAGIATLGAALEIVNSTISENVSLQFEGGGIYQGPAASLELLNVTVTANEAEKGAGIAIADTAGMTRLDNSLIAGNINDDTRYPGDVWGAVDYTSRFNLIGNGADLTGIVDGLDGNQIGTTALPIDPQLGPLSNNGGATWTHALLIGSPAIDAADTAIAPVEDQRGVPRPIGLAADTGAFEADIPIITSTKTDLLAVDVDGTGQVNPGDTIEYHVTVTNVGAKDALDTLFTDTLDSNTTLVPGSITVTPLALDDTYAGVADMELIVDGTSGLLANDFDIDGAAPGTNTELSVVLSSVSRVDGNVSGSLIVNTDGSFEYVPPAGQRGFETFQYNIVDADDLNAVVPGFVTLDISSNIWFIDNSREINGNGSLTSPFNSFAEVNGANGENDVDEPGDIIFVFAGTEPYGEGMVELENEQQLIGEGSGLTIGSSSIVPAGDAPVITNSSGHVIHLMNGNIVRGIEIFTPYGFGIYGDSVSGGLIEQTTIDGTVGGSGVGIFFQDATDSIAVRDVNVNRGFLAVALVGGGDFTFDDVTIEQSAVGLTIGHGVDAEFRNGSSITTEGVAIEALSFDGLLTFDASTSIVVSNGGGVQFDGSAGEARFDGTFTMNNVDVGISTIGGSSGTYTFGPGTTINNPTDTAIEIGVLAESDTPPIRTGGSAHLVFEGIITQATGTRTVQVFEHDGTLTFNGSISASSGDGLHFNDADGTYDFSGPITLDGGDAGIDILDDSDGTFTFTNVSIDNASGGTGVNIVGGTAKTTFAGLDVSTNGGTGLFVDGTGLTTVNNMMYPTAISSVGAPAVNLVNGPVSISFTSLTSSGSPNDGIVLGDLGGTMTVVEATVDGMAAGFHGINISNSSTAIFTFDSVDIDDTGGAGIQLNNAGTVNILGGSIDGAADDGIHSTNTALTVDLTSIGVNAGIGDDGIEVVNSDAVDRDVAITNSNIFPLAGTGISNRGIFINSDGTGTLAANVTTNMIQSTNQAILTTDGGMANSLVLDLQNSTITTTAPGVFTQQHVGSGLHSTIVRSWNYPNQVTGLTGGGIQFDQVSFDSDGDPSNGLQQVVFGGTGELQIGAAPSRVQGEGLSLLATTGSLSIPTLNIFNTGGAGLNIDATGTAFAFAAGGGIIDTADEAGVRALNLSQGSLSNMNITSGAGFSAVLVDLHETGLLNNLAVINNTLTPGGGDASGAVVNTSGTVQACVHAVDNQATGSGSGFGLELNQVNPSVLAITQSSPTELNDENPLITSLHTTGVITFDCGAAPLLASPELATTLPEIPPNSHTAETSAADRQAGKLGPGKVLSPRLGSTDSTLNGIMADDGVLDDEELAFMLHAAIQRWTATGLNPTQLAALQAVQFEIVDLPGWYLGSAAGGTILIDTDGGGHGWFIDPTPLEDSEFTVGNTVGMDLLTTLMHEMGHVLGLQDIYDASARSDLMNGFLTLGQRRIPQVDQAVGAVPGSVTSTAFIGSPIEIGTLPAGKAVAITFQATINDPFPPDVTQVHNQGMVTGSNFADVATADPDSTDPDAPTITDVHPPVVPDMGVIVGRKFDDRNGDGAHDPGEPLLNGITIELRDAEGMLLQTRITSDMDLDNNQIIDPLTERGLYEFADLSAATYWVTEVVPDGWNQTSPTHNAALTPTSGGAGAAWFVLDAISGDFYFNIDYGQLSGAMTGLVIQSGGTGSTDPVIHDLLAAAGVDPGAEGPIDGTVVLSPSEVVALDEGQLFVNLQTDAFPLGETSGQINTSAEGQHVVPVIDGLVLQQRDFGNVELPPPCSLIVTHTGDSGIGSLREAIVCANKSTGPDTIRFEIPETDAGYNPDNGPAGAFTIEPLSPLPVVTEPVIIDGTTQPGAACGANGVHTLRIEINGAGLQASGLVITAGGSTVRGLVINQFGADGINLLDLGGNTIACNYIGTNVSGTADVGNAQDGIYVYNSTDNLIGGATLAARNLISGNDEDGIGFWSGSSGNEVQGNFIGTDWMGISNLGNGEAGVRLEDAANNWIQENVIAFNGGQVPSTGVVAAGTNAVGNRILANSIFENFGLGIDLVGGNESPDGVTENDSQDPDVGPNNLQNYPVLSHAVGGSLTTVSGTLDSLPDTGFRLEFFANDVLDTSGFGEGKEFLGSILVTTDSQGLADFVFDSPTNVPVGRFITATATRLVEGETPIETSEFSLGMEVVVEPEEVADLSLTKQVDDTRPQVGDNIVFTITVSNAGPDTATGVEVTDQLPSGLVFLDWTGSGTYDTSSGVWTVGTVPVGADTILQISATVATADMTTNTAEVTAADQLDPNSTPGNGVETEDDQDSVHVTPQVADLSLQKEIGNQAPAVGQEVTFTVVVTNSGPDTATGIEVTDLLPYGLTFYDAETTQGDYTSGNGLWNVGSLVNQTSATLIIRATLESDQPLVNTAEVTAADQYDPNSTPGNNVPSEDDQSSVSIGQCLTGGPLQIGTNRLIYSCATPGSISAFVLGSQFGNYYFKDYRTTVDIADPEVLALGVANIHGVAVVHFELTKKQANKTLLFQAFEMMPNPHTSNVLTLETPPKRLYTVDVGPGAVPLDPDQLPELLDAAISRWETAGISDSGRSLLQSTRIGISELPDNVIGGVVGNTVLLDRDAAGHGWFVDLTPADDVEFLRVPEAYELQAFDGAASAQLDALTVVMHELGHILGLPDRATPGHLMYDELASGTRRLPVSYTNWRLPLDVDVDGLVTPRDALLVINALNRSSHGEPEDLENGVTSFLDTNGDYLVSPLDALLVINHLNKVAVGDAEGEASSESDRLPIASFAADLLIDNISVAQVRAASTSDALVKTRSESARRVRRDSQPIRVGHEAKRQRLETPGDVYGDRWTDLEPLLDELVTDIMKGHRERFRERLSDRPTDDDLVCQRL